MDRTGCYALACLFCIFETIMKKILATGAMLAYITWFNSTGALAATMPEIVASEVHGPKHHQNARHTKHAHDKLVRLAEKFGIDHNELEQDLQSTKSIKEILKKHGITNKQFREVMGKRR